MLRRDRQIRTVIQQLADASLFAVAFWVAYALRANPEIIAWLKLEPPSPFANFAWLYLVLIPATPLVLESQGFYDHSPLCSRGAILWPLFKGCLLVTVGLMLTVYVFHLIVARAIFVSFGCIGFCLVYLKEEGIRLVLKSKMAQSQYQAPLHPRRHRTGNRQNARGVEGTHGRKRRNRGRLQPPGNTRAATRAHAPSIIPSTA